MNDERHILTNRVGIWGIIGNIFLFIIKIVIGVISHSKSMIADSINSAGDIFASLLTWLGNRISSVPNDEDHNFGHGKAEYIFSMMIGTSMIVVGIKMLYDSVVAIIQQNVVIYSPLLIVIAVVTILTKILLYLFTHSIYMKTNNLLVKSNMIDHRNDVFITFCTLLAIVFAKYNIYFVDGIVGIGISIWIMISGMKIYRESYNVLMDHAIDDKSRKMILKIIRQNKEIKRIGDIYSIPIGYKYVIVLTIYVDGDMSTNDSHSLADKLEDKIKENMDKIENVIVHIEPYNK